MSYGRRAVLAATFAGLMCGVIGCNKDLTPKFGPQHPQDVDVDAIRRLHASLVSKVEDIAAAVRNESPELKRCRTSLELAALALKRKEKLANREALQLFAPFLDGYGPLIDLLDSSGVRVRGEVRVGYKLVPIPGALAMRDLVARAVEDAV